MNNKDRLEKLLEITIEDLIAKIETGEASSADLSVARAILKDNCIDVNVNTDEDPQAKKLMNTVTNFPFAPKKANG